MQNGKKQNMLFASVVFDKNTNTAWAIGIERNGLFKLSLESGEYKLLTCFADDYFKYAINDKCYKYKNNIFCFPCKGDIIWVYNLQSRELDKIQVEHNKDAEPTITMIVEESGTLFAVANGLNKILEIDPERKKIVNSYKILQDEKEVYSSITGVVVEKKLYFITVDNNSVCEFDLVTKEICFYSVVNDNIKLNTICYDGNYFWFSGRKKEIFRWDKDTGEVCVISDFPVSFGKYEINETDNFHICYQKEYNSQIFRSCMFVGGTLWFIPHETNQIIYVDKDSCTIDSFLIEEEEEDKFTWQRGRTKYRLECIYKDRYILLFSYKNNRYLKIDTVLFTYEYMDVWRSKEENSLLADQLFRGHDIVSEDERDILLTDMIKGSFSINKRESDGNVGKEIYQFILQSNK